MVKKARSADRVRLAAAQTDSIAWQVNTTAGDDSFEPIAADGAWHGFAARARVRTSVIVTAMNKEAGMPLPETSPTTAIRRLLSGRWITS